MQNLVLAEHKQVPYVSSAEFAEGLRANPALVRRLLTILVQSGLLESRLGRNGGVRLARRPEHISLAEIYEAAAPDKRVLREPRRDLPQRCIVSTFFEDYFEDLSLQADRALLDVLARQSLADSFAALKTRETHARSRPGYRSPYDDKARHPRALIQ